MRCDPGHRAGLLRQHLWAQDGDCTSSGTFHQKLFLETAEFTFLIKTGLKESGEVMAKHASVLRK